MIINDARQLVELNIIRNLCAESTFCPIALIFGQNSHYWVFRTATAVEGEGRQEKDPSKT